jgi:hypothetical protein
MRWAQNLVRTACASRGPRAAYWAQNAVGTAQRATLHAGSGRVAYYVIMTHCAQSIMCGQIHMLLAGCELPLVSKLPLSHSINCFTAHVIHCLSQPALSKSMQSVTGHQAHEHAQSCGRCSRVALYQYGRTCTTTQSSGTANFATLGCDAM